MRYNIFPILIFHFRCIESEHTELTPDKIRLHCKNLAVIVEFILQQILV
jgi:hypothetical protein